MNPAQLLTHFDRMADAPDAVPQLRRFVLDLAMRGKLVEQDPKDEPVSELLKTLRQSRSDRGSERQKRTAALSPVTRSEVPFDVPCGWCWERLGNIGETNIGLTYSPADIAEVGIPVLRSGNIQKGRLDLSDLVRVEIELKESVLAQEGDLLICARNGSRSLVGKVALIETLPEAMAFGAFMAIFRSRLNQYLYHFICSPLFRQVIDEVNTTTINQITQNNLRSTPAPIPPLAEQQRIVAKVDELMALCDKLEAAQTERENRRDRLVSATLQRLTQPAEDATSFRDHARFALDNLSRLTTRPEHIPQLRQTILNLGVRGKLVPQDPKDEPAAELLKRIQDERAQLVKDGEAKEQKNLRADAENDERSKLPGSWRWVALADIALSFRYGTSVKCSYETEGEPVLRIPNVAAGRISLEDLKYGKLPDREIDELRLQLGDILMVRSNGSLDLVGRAALVEKPAVGYCYAGYLVRVRTSVNHLNTRYLVLALSSTHVRQQIEIPIRTTVGLKNVNTTELGCLSIPLPPLAEQRRIVAKVDELMALCDRLESQLTTTQTESRHLLEAVLHEALSNYTPDLVIR